MSEDIKITRWSKPKDVQDALVQVTSKDRWREGRWWRDFLSVRRQFFATQDMSDSESEEGKKRLEEAFLEWIRKHPSAWWAQGGWVEHAVFAEWHVIQYLRVKKSPSGTKDLSAKDSAAEKPSPIGYWDPARADAATT